MGMRANVVLLASGLAYGNKIWRAEFGFLGIDRISACGGNLIGGLLLEFDKAFEWLHSKIGV
jgi:hypothetical protein